jgi:hypothetical protein
LEAAIKLLMHELKKCQNYHRAAYHDIEYWRDKGLVGARHVRDMQHGQAAVFKQIDQLRDALTVLKSQPGG